MNFLEERITKDGIVKEGNVLKVDSFLNHQMDVPFLQAIGQAFQLTYGTKVYTFYIVGVYPYESNGLVLESIDATPTTDMYLPISTAKAMSHADDGYQSFTVVAATGVDTSAFLTQTENFFAGYYTRNTSYTATASSMESLMESMT